VNLTHVWIFKEKKYVITIDVKSVGLCCPSASHKATWVKRHFQELDKYKLKNRAVFSLLKMTT